MRISVAQRVWTFLLAVVIATSGIPLSVLAQDTGYDRDYRIIGFSGLESEVTDQTVSLEKAYNEIIFPERLNVTYYDANAGDDSEAVSGRVPVENWDPDRTFDPKADETYIFTPRLSLGWSVEGGAEPPTLQVRILPTAIVAGMMNRVINLKVPERDFSDMDMAYPEESSSVHGDALTASLPYARALYDVLMTLSADDDPAAFHAIELGEADRLSRPLPLGYSDGDAGQDALEQVMDQIVNNDIVTQIAQPAADAFWADYPLRYWLGGRMSLKLDYTIESDTLYVEKIHFGFDYLQVQSFGLLSVEATLTHDNQPITTDGTLEDAIAKVNALGAAASIEKTIITLQGDVKKKPLTFLQSLAFPCTIDGNGYTLGARGASG
ncbi:MAG: hypothetical protein LBV27_04305, partial [Oscillospiraceae bacterium]|nr:hypothetical protein [Oscillospiraceae bacterium]